MEPESSLETSLNLARGGPLKFEFKHFRTSFMGVYDIRHRGTSVWKHNLSLERFLYVKENHPLSE